MRVAVVDTWGGIEGVARQERPDPTPAAEQVLIRVHGVGVGPWDVGFVGGGAPWLTLPFVPGFEVAGIVEEAADGADVQPGDRVYASLWPDGGGLAESALASVGRVAPMPEGLSFPEAASLVIAGGTAHEGLIDRGRLEAGDRVLIVAAAGGVGSLAVQIAVAAGAIPFGVASPRNHEYLRALGVSEVFDYHVAGWAQQVLAAAPGGVDMLFDLAGGQTKDQAIAAVRDGGRVISVVPPFDRVPLERGITSESFAAYVGRQRLEALSRFVAAGRLRPQVEAVLPFDQVREALGRVASRHTRGKVVVQIRQ